MHWFIKLFFLNLFWIETLHVSDSSSFLHQEFFSVHTAVVYVIIQFCRQLANCLQNCMTCTIAMCTLRNSWWWTEELSETCRVSIQNKLKKKFHKSVHLVGFIIWNLSQCMVTWTSNEPNLVLSFCVLIRCLSCVLQSCSLNEACFLCLSYRGALLDLTIIIYQLLPLFQYVCVWGGGGREVTNSIGQIEQCPCICEVYQMFIVNDLWFCINFGTGHSDKFCGSN
jgi:hypothetical protein